MIRKNHDSDFYQTLSSSFIKGRLDREKSKTHNHPPPPPPFFYPLSLSHPSTGQNLLGSHTLCVCHTSSPSPRCKKKNSHYNSKFTHPRWSKHTCSHACTHSHIYTCQIQQSRNKTNPSVSVVDLNPLFHLAS